jgi:RimJ/RimL family protein N-acetyltransferase
VNAQASPTFSPGTSSAARNVRQAIELAVRRPLRDDDLGQPLSRLGEGKVAMAAIMHAFAGVGGPSAVSQISPSTSLAEALCWLDAHVAKDRGVIAPRKIPVRLRPLADADFGPLYRTACDPANGFRWRFRGATVSPEEFQRLLWSGVLAQFIVEGVEDRERYGLVTSYNAQPDLGHAYIAFYRCSIRRGQGEMMAGAYLLINHLFSSFPFRKLYAEVPGYNELTLGLRNLKPFSQEGCLRDHYFHDGKWWDHQIFSTTRSEWTSFTNEFVDPYLSKEPG